MSTVMISLLLSAVLGLIIRHLYRQKKQGKSPCSCGCSGCGMKGICHKERE